MMDESEIHSRRISAKEELISRKGDEFIFRVAYVAPLKPVPTSGRFEVTSFIVVTLNLEFQLHMLKEESFPTPLKYIDVTIHEVHSQATTRTDNFWPDVWSGNGKSSSEKRKGKNGRTKKPKLDSARKAERHLFHRSERWRIKKEAIKKQEKVGSSDGGGNALQNGNTEALGAPGN